MHKDNNLRGMGPHSSGTCHLFLAVTWWACSEARLERGPGAQGERMRVCLGAERCHRILEQYISASVSSHAWDLLQNLR